VQKLIEKRQTEKQGLRTIPQPKQAHLESDRIKTHFKAAKEFLVST
jgi:hypothetical protein